MPSGSPFLKALTSSSSDRSKSFLRVKQVAQVPERRREVRIGGEGLLEGRDRLVGRCPASFRMTPSLLYEPGVRVVPAEAAGAVPLSAM